MKSKILIFIFLFFILYSCGVNKKIVSTSKNIDTTTVFKIENDSVYTQKNTNEKSTENTQIEENIEIIKIDSTKKIVITTKINRIINKNLNNSKIDSINNYKIKRDSLSFSSIKNDEIKTTTIERESQKIKYISFIFISIAAIFICIVIFKIFK